MIPRSKRAGGRTALAQGLTLCLLTGALQALGAQWVQTVSLPGSYEDHSLAYASGYLYQAGGAGGNGGLSDGTNVFYSQVHNDGTIGIWKHTTSLPGPVLNHAGVAANGSVYVLGGLQWNLVNYTAVIIDTVRYANINSDGSLGSWQTANSLPNTLQFLSASVWNNRIYAIGGTDGNYLYNTVYSATIQTNGSLSAWTLQAPLPVAIFTHAAAANGFLYVLGGGIDNANEVASSVYYAKINADGTLAGWNQTISLPQPLSSFCAVAANGWVFAMGGWNGTGPTTGFYGAAVKGDGSLGSWSSGDSLAQPLQQFAATTSDSCIFFTGGVSTEANSGAVFSMSLPPPPAAPKLVSGRFPNGDFQIQLASSSTNTGFGIQASTDLMTWTTAGSGFTDTNGVLLFQDANAALFPNQFYRAYWPLP